ncbi:unnamed protein product [Rotaria sordida]|uniref:K Homology domain-containing protein n=1 Tax=Rotaria sordida TaxID=392033 RepID=A0A819HE62_9BILA|nr:unnamed protein product [Rotaria sordida]
MVDLELKKSLPLDKSYHRVIEELNTWHTNIIKQLNEMHDNIFFDMKRTFDDVHYFASFTNELLIEQENQLKKAKSHEEIDIIQERINQLVSEVQFLQLLSFHLNYDSVKFNGKLRINYNNNEIKSNSSLITTTFPCLYNTSQTIFDSSEFSTNNKQSILSYTKYRFLISRIDAIELKKNFSSIFHLTSYNNELINDCILTFNVFNLDSFLNAFTFYWNLFSNKNEIRMLIIQNNILFLMNKLNEISYSLIKRFQLDEIKIFSNLCPKSDEKILLIKGKQRNLMKDCIKEIYFNIEENNKNQYIKQNIKLYNPANLSKDDINEIILSNLDYGGFISNQTRLTTAHHSQMHITEDEESDDDDDEDDDDELWDENDEWWNFQNTRDNNTDIVQREMTISNKYADVVIGVNTSYIDRIKQKTGANISINDETNDLKRTIIMKGTREQVDRAYACIDNLIERHINDKLSMHPKYLHGERKEK